jgi:hypothetical protein
MRNRIRLKEGVEIG